MDSLTHVSNQAPGKRRSTRVKLKEVVLEPKTVRGWAAD